MSPVVTVGEAELRARKEAEDIVQRYVHVQGLDRADDAVLPRDIRLQVSVGDSPVATKLRFLYAPNRTYRLEVELPGQPPYTEGSGTHGNWLLGEARGVGHPLDPSDMWRFLSKERATAKKIAQTYAAKQRMPDKVVDGKKYAVVAMQQFESSGWEFWFFDPEIGVLERTEFSLTGKYPEATTVYSDFKMIDGVLEPMLMVHGAGANRTTVRRLALTNRAEVNEERDFHLPAAAVAEWDKTQLVMAKYMKASGGVLNQSKIVSRVTKSKCEVTTTGVKYAMTVSQKLPDWIVVENNVPGVGQSWDGYNGQTGWSSNELSGYRTLRGEELRLFIRSNDLHNAADFGKPYRMRRFIGSKMLNGRAATVLMLGDEGGLAGTYFFDVLTGLLMQVESVLALDGGGKLPVTIEFSDYRSVDGVMLPYTTIVTNPAMRMVTTVESVQHNLELSDDLFQPRKDL